MLLYIWKMYLEINVKLISRIEVNLGEVLKLRMPTITKEQLKLY